MTRAAGCASESTVTYQIPRFLPSATVPGFFCFFFPNGTFFIKFFISFLLRVVLKRECFCCQTGHAQKVQLQIQDAASEPLSRRLEGSKAVDGRCKN